MLPTVLQKVKEPSEERYEVISSSPSCNCIVVRLTYEGGYEVVAK